MKGIVFTEFLEMVEDRFSVEIVERVIEASSLPSRGVYTSVGTYDHNEIIELVSNLSTLTGIAVPDLLQAFGEHLFGRFVSIYPHFFEGIQSAFVFLQKIEDYIHVEVKKLYPDAMLPNFEYDTSTSGQMIMTYRSSRPFADIAEGLIKGCIRHFGEKIEIRREQTPGNQGTYARFILTKQD